MQNSQLKRSLGDKTLIKLIVFDIDGVITDGAIIVDINGNEQKKVNLKDVDAIFELHRSGYELAAITGENTAIVDYFENRFPWKYFYRNNKHKLDAIKEIAGKENLTMDEICYIGDGKYDVEPLMYSGLGVCPANAIDKAKEAADIILQYPGGQGCLWELVSIIKQFNEEDIPQNYFYRRLTEHENVFKTMASDQDMMLKVMKLAEEIIASMKNGGTLYLCGNGGSAADAQHIAAEFVSRFFKERKGLSAEALSTNTSIITAIGNDYSYERIFVRQLEAKAKRGDVLIGISTSGKSKNVVEALQYAKDNGITTAVMTGNFDVPALKDCCDYIIKVPSTSTPRIQEGHIFIGHTIAEYVESKMLEK